MRMPSGTLAPGRAPASMVNMASFAKVFLHETQPELDKGKVSPLFSPSDR
jgi:hypothetical protein